VTATATVVVVSWNGAHLLRRCLPALLAQELPGGFEVVVVDNASADDTLDLLRTEYPGVRVVANTENLGFAGGNNSALRDVTTPYAVLLNNDAIPQPGWLAALLAPFADAEKVGITTGKVLFAARYARISLSTSGFSPGPQDPRELGVRVHRVEVDGQEVTGAVLWGSAGWGPEAGFQWTRAEGELLVPLSGPGPWKVGLLAAAERTKPLTLSWDGGAATVEVPAEEPGGVMVELPAGLALADVVNNAGGVFLTTGYGADLLFQRLHYGR
jgi:glycosyltransferase involved in cell wall biosynthesis